MNDENTPKEKEVKRRFQSWLRPSTIKLMDRLYEDDNCKSRSEFIEKGGSLLCRISFHTERQRVSSQRGDLYAEKASSRRATTGRTE